MNSGVKFFRELLAVLILATLIACRSVPVFPTPIPTAQPPAPSALVSAPRPAATATRFQTPPPDDNRIAATIHLNNPLSMAVGGGFIWVISGGSVVRIDPKTNQVVGKPIPAGVQFESDVAFGEGALWVTVVGSGDLGAPNDTDAVARIDPETGETVAKIKVRRGPVSLAITLGVVWVVNFGMSGDAVTQIDAKTNQITGKPVKTGRAPLSMTVGDGSLWVANHDAHTVTRIDPNTAIPG